MNPSPFEIAQGVGNTLGRVSRGQRDKSAIDEILEKAAQSGGTDNLDMAMSQILARVSPERQKPALAILQSKKQAILDERKFNREKDLIQQRELDKRQYERDKEKDRQEFQTQRDLEKRIYDQEQDRLKREREAAGYEKAGLDPNLAELPTAVANKRISEEARLKEQDRQKAEKKDITQKSFDRLADLIGSVGTVNAGISYLPFASKTRESFGEFDSLVGALESGVRELVNQGRITNDQFRYITTQLLPKSNDTQARIKGKMKALAIELGLDPTKVGGIKAPKGDLSEEQKAERPDIEVFQL